MVRGDGIGDVLQQHGLAGSRRSNNQTPLSFADRRQQVHDASTDILTRCLQLQPDLGIKRREVVKQDLVARLLG